MADKLAATASESNNMRMDASSSTYAGLNPLIPKQSGPGGGLKFPLTATKAGLQRRLASSEGRMSARNQLGEY
ncbi:hypothetical protein AVEN_36620-1 [Araneus ventricosus]|uniref:Uncharacterized protein n=1 Tax=Araneus ventricosus TaxID=182803 RepID=A0A4Y2UZP7_ARAVE|nr:hypothetical protein AVEN_36620-1 [Araneus ventricosus]